MTNYTGESADGYISSSNATYSVARSTSYGCDSVGVTIGVGQRKQVGMFSLRRGCISIPTAAIPDDATVTAATLYVKAQADYSTTDFNIQVYRYAWAEPLCDNREANYDGAYGSGVLEGTLRNTADGWIANTSYSLAVATAGINLAGDTKYCLVSSRDVAGTTPTGDEFVFLYSADSTGNEPYLAITYVTPVSSSVQAKWDMAGQVDSSVQAKWDMRNEVAGTVQAKYDTLATASGSVQAKWDTLLPVTSTVQAKWYIEGRSTLQAKWDMVNHVRSTVQAKWDSGGKVVSTVQAVWDCGSMAKEYLTLELPDSTLTLDLPENTLTLELPDSTLVLDTGDENMKELRLTEGSAGPSLTITVKQAGSAIDLSGASVVGTFHMRVPGGSSDFYTATLTSLTASGTAVVPFTSASLVTPGEYLCDVKFTGLSGGTQRTFMFKVIVEQSNA